MNTITPLHSVLDRMMTLTRAMDGTLGFDDSMTGLAGSRARAQMWLPAVDTYETEGAFMVEADLPGVDLENLEISFEQNTLTIKGVRASTFQAPENGELRVFSSERMSGPFARSIRLPEYVEGEKIEADYRDGVLKVQVPKAPSARARKIPVSSGGEPNQIRNGARQIRKGS